MKLKVQSTQHGANKLYYHEGKMKPSSKVALHRAGNIANTVMSALEKKKQSLAHKM